MAEFSFVKLKTLRVGSSLTGLPIDDKNPRDLR